MMCPICEYDYSDQFKFLLCDNLDDSYLYKDVCIHKCRYCGHMFNELSFLEIGNLKKYYEKEHSREGINVEYSNPADDNSMVFVILDHVLEHVVSPRAALREVKRVLKKGGVCHIHVPDADRYNDNYFWILREHIQHFTLPTIKWLAETTGFELISYKRDEFLMIGELKCPNLSVVLKPSGTTYCYGIGREFMYLYPNTRLKYMDLILVDDLKTDKTFQEMEIHSSDILKNADKDSFLIITAGVHKDLLLKKAKELGFKGEIINV